jgi:GNAT superfamily N-acetyltransferase
VSKVPSAVEWSPIGEGEIRRAERLGNKVHLAYPEDYRVFHRKYELFPDGFYALKDAAGELKGYGVFHPWVFGAPPRLNHYLDRLPEPCDALHLHDIVIAEAFRGRGLTGDFLRLFLGAAKHHGKSKATLVAVGGTEPLWRRFGFDDPQLDSSKDAVSSYGATSRYMARDP